MKSILETLFEHSWVGVLLLCLYLMMHELKLPPCCFGPSSYSLLSSACGAWLSLASPKKRRNFVR
jgi:hypothetical protein